MRGAALVVLDSSEYHHSFPLGKCMSRFLSSNHGSTERSSSATLDLVNPVCTAKERHRSRQDPLRLRVRLLASTAPLKGSLFDPTRYFKHSGGWWLGRFLVLWKLEESHGDKELRVECDHVSQRLRFHD